MKVGIGLVVLLAISRASGLADTMGISVTDAWSRPANVTGVVYAKLRNNSAVADRLVGASSPSASHVGLHESTEITMPGLSTSMGNMPMNGSMTSMKSVSSIPVPAHGTTPLAPGGYHLMLDLRRDLKAGETYPLRLHFARAGWVSTTVHVSTTR